MNSVLNLPANSEETRAGGDDSRPRDGAVVQQRTNDSLLRRWRDDRARTQPHELVMEPVEIGKAARDCKRRAAKLRQRGLRQTSDNGRTVRRRVRRQLDAQRHQNSHFTPINRTWRQWRRQRTPSTRRNDGQQRDGSHANPHAARLGQKPQQERVYPSITSNAQREDTGTRPHARRNAPSWRPCT